MWLRPLESAKFEFKWKFADVSYVETQSQHGYLSHVAPPLSQQNSSLSSN